jgi:hypothetical protein
VSCGEDGRLCGSAVRLCCRKNWQQHALLCSVVRARAIALCTQLEISSYVDSLTMNVPEAVGQLGYLDTDN